MVGNRKGVGKIIKQRRIMMLMTLRDLATNAGVSPSYLGRIEKGDRFPSARILHKLAGPLGFSEAELFAWANYLPPEPPSTASDEEPPGKLDPYVAMVLSQEPREIQRATLTILSMVRYAAEGIAEETEFGAK